MPHNKLAQDYGPEIWDKHKAVEIDSQKFWIDKKFADKLNL